MHHCMIRFRFVVVALALSFGFQDGAGAASSQPKPPDGYVPLPKTVEFPLSEETINGYVSTQNMDQIRRHGWELFHGLQKPVKVEQAPGIDVLSVWQTWFSVSQAFAPKKKVIDQPAYRELGKHALGAMRYAGSAALSEINAGTSAVVHPLHPEAWQKRYNQQKPKYPPCKDGGCKDGVLFANNGDIMIAGEYYSWPAIEHLRGRGLYRQSVLLEMLEKGQTSIPVFPRESIVLKTMHWPVASSGLTALPVWDNDPARPPYQYNGYESWRRAVAIDPNRAQIPPGETATVKTLYNVDVPGTDTPRTFENAKVVPLSAFYHLTVTEQLWQALDADDKILLNRSANWAYNRDFKAGDAVALIAFHINTKEIVPWTLQSFWWHDQPNVGPFAESRPSLPAGPWQNYLMKTAYDQVTPREYDGTNHVAYNPYVELVTHPIPTNCQNCHARAAYPSSNSQLHPPDQTHFAKYDDNPEGREKVTPKSAELKGLLRTDYLWTIADRAIGDQ